MKLIVIVYLLLTAVVLGQPKQIGIADFPPLIIIEGDKITGSDFDTFELIASNSGWKRGEDYEYKVFPSFADVMKSIAAGEIDVALDGISITEKRLRKMEFSLPYKMSGQRILILPPKSHISILAYVGQFFRMDIAIGIFVLILNFALFGVLLWFAEYRHKDRNIMKLGQGAQASFDIGTTIGFGRFYPVTPVGNVVAGVCFLTTAILIGSLIATLTTNKLVHTLETTINGPDDLQAKKVACVGGTTSYGVVKEYNPTQVVPCKSFYAAVVELRLGNVDAVVADDPVVLNYVKEHPDHAATAGVMFHPEQYGIAVSSKNLELVKPFSIAIAQLRENGKLDLIDRHWFGE